MVQVGHESDVQGFELDYQYSFLHCMYLFKYALH